MADRTHEKEDAKNSSTFNDQQKKRIKLFDRMISTLEWYFYQKQPINIIFVKQPSKKSS